MTLHSARTGVPEGVPVKAWRMGCSQYDVHNSDDKTDMEERRLCGYHKGQNELVITAPDSGWSTEKQDTASPAVLWRRCGWLKASGTSAGKLWQPEQ